MGKILKHKSLILAAVLPLAFWAGLFGFWFFKDSKSADANPIIIKNNSISNSNNISRLASISATQIDEDNDGLSDWEESIYGTDPKKSDTDADGYLDGEEILSGRDPLKKGPNDQLEIKNKKSVDTENQTATEKILKLAVENSVKTINSNNASELNETQIAQILAQSFNDPQMSQKLKEALKSELYYFIPPNLEELKIIKDNEKNTKIYWENMRKSFEAMIKTEPKEDFFQVIGQSAQTNNFSKLDGFIVFYQSSYEAFQKIEIPLSLSQNHKNMLTVLYKYWKISESIKTLEQNPARTLLALNQLTEITRQYFK